jgi:hypothetical protein
VLRRAEEVPAEERDAWAMGVPLAAQRVAPATVDRQEAPEDKGVAEDKAVAEDKRASAAAAVVRAPASPIPAARRAAWNASFIAATRATAAAPTPARASAFAISSRDV